MAWYCKTNSIQDNTDTFLHKHSVAGYILKTPTSALDHEIVFPSEMGSFKWFEHDVPSPLVRWHFHDAFELHYLAATSGKTFVGDYVGEFHPNSFFLIGPNLPHNWISDLEPGSKKIARDIFVQFKWQLIENLQVVFPEFQSINEMLKQAQNGLEFYGRTAKNAGNILRSLGTKSDASRVVEFLSLLSELSNSNERRQLASSGYAHSIQVSELRKLNQVIERIYVDYENNLSIGEFASELCMSASTFSRFFKKNTGMNFVAFVNKVRIDNACVMLKNSNYSISEICYECGFRNLSNFNRIFLKSKGETPKSYRQSQ